MTASAGAQMRIHSSTHGPSRVARTAALLLALAAGALAAWCLNKGLSPRQVRNETSLLTAFQEMLVDRLGFKLEWPEYARITPR